MSQSNDGWGNITTKLVLPDPVDPPDSVCYLVRVPNSKYHITAFLGAIFDLSLWWNWQRDDVHTASRVAQVWRKIWYNLRAQDCNPVIEAVNGCEDECMCCLKYIDGVLNQLVCGVWVPVEGAPAANQSGQPGNGSPQPAPGGGQQAYDGCLTAATTWLLPTNVSTGDTISLESVSGAWNDPDTDGPVWRCQDGNIFFAGSCSPLTTTLVGTDPLPTAPHMAFVLQIAGTFYDFSSGAFTVPGGISNQQVILQANDSYLADDNGQLCFTLNVVNNQAAHWSHDFDLTMNSFATKFALINDTNFTNPQGIYVPGAGWQTALLTPAASPTWRVRQFRLQSLFPVNYTALRLTFAYAAGAQNAGVSSVDFYVNNKGVSTVDSVPTGTGVTSPRDIPAHNCTNNIEISFIPGSDNTSSDPGGSATLQHIHIEGVGTDPFV